MKQHYQPILLIMKISLIFTSFLLLIVFTFACGSQHSQQTKDQEKPMTLMEKQRQKMAQSYVGMSKNQKNAQKPVMPIKAVQAIEKNQSKDNPVKASQDQVKQTMKEQMLQKKQEALDNLSKEPATQPLDKLGFLKRLNAYPLCMISDATQRELIPIRSYEVDRIDDQIYDLIEVECVFFAYQGSFEYWLFERSTGELLPLLFDLAQTADIQGNERKTPVAIRDDETHELCGIPSFDPKTKLLKSLCKGDPQGSCGAYAEFELMLSALSFKKIKAKQQLCSDGFGLNQNITTELESWMNVQ
jgi:hypothetical protein